MSESSASDSSDPPSISSSLLEGARQGLPEAWRQLSYLYGPVVLSWLRAAGLQASDAEDVRQEVFRTVSSNLSKFRRERPGDTFRGWLWTITRNKLLDHRRRQQPRAAAVGGTEMLRQMAELPDSVGSLALESEAIEQKLLLKRGLELVRGDFEPKTWQAFWRVTMDEAPAAEVAVELRMSVNSIYVAKSRVIRRLREELGEFIDFTWDDG